MTDRKRELVFTSKTLIIQKEGLKKKIDLQDGHSTPQLENESYSNGEGQKASNKEHMRYIIHYRQNMDSILAWKEHQGYRLLGI